MTPKKILVTGGAGYLGSRVVQHLLEQGAQVLVLDKLLYGGEALLPFFDHPHFNLLVGDCRDMELVKKNSDNFETVVHLASLVGDDACKVSPDATISINQEASIRLMETLRDIGGKQLIFMSTCSNYGVSSPDVLADEQSELNPISLYAETKVAAEKAILAADPSRITATVLRFGTICGLSSRMRFNLMVSEMARAAVLGKEIDIYKPHAWRPFLHINDACRVIWHIAQSPAEKICARVFNVVGENLQKTDLVEMTKKHFPNVKIKITDAQADNRDYRASSALIEKELGFKPIYTIEDAFLDVARAIEKGLFTNPFKDEYIALPKIEDLNQTSSV